MRCVGSRVMPFPDASPLRADRGVLCQSNPHFCRGRSTRREGRVNPYTDLPLRADLIPVFVGAGICAERTGSTHAQTCPYAPTAAFCAKAIPVFCRGEAELSKTRSQGFSLAPTPRHAVRCPAPTRRPRRSVPWQYPFFVGATLAPHCVWCSAGEHPA